MVVPTTQVTAEAVRVSARKIAARGKAGGSAAPTQEPATGDSAAAPGRETETPHGQDTQP